MNSYSSFNIITRNNGPDINSISYVNTLAKNYTVDICGGTSFSNLSGIASYSINARGINPGNQGSTYLAIKNGGNVLQTSNFASSINNSFTFYVKSASRFNTNPILGHGYALTTSVNSIIVGSSFNVIFCSLFDQINIPYTISGVTVSDLNIASLQGNFTKVFQTLTYNTQSTAVNKTFSIRSGNITTTVAILPPPIIYFVRLYNNDLMITDESNNVFTRPRLCFFGGRTYKFYQTDTTNTLHQIYFSTTPNGTFNGGIPFTAGVTVNGIPGQENAFTTLSLLVDTNLFYCCDISGAGSSNLDTIWKSSTTLFTNNPPQDSSLQGQFNDFDPTGYKSIFCSKDGRIVWLIPGNTNIYVSIDYGKNFILFGRSQSFHGFMTGTCDDTGYIVFLSYYTAPNQVYGTVQYGYIYKLDYYNRSITDITSNIGENSYNYNVKLNSTGSSFIVVSDTAIYKSTNLGTTFTRILSSISKGLGKSPGCIGMDSTGTYIVSCGNYFYEGTLSRAGTGTSYFYKSTNSGDSWDTSFNNQPTGFPASNTTGKFQYAAYSYNGAALVVYIYEQGLYYSNNYGYNWSKLAISETVFFGAYRNSIISNPNFVLDLSGRYLVYNTNSSSDLKYNTNSYSRRYDLLTNSINNLAPATNLFTSNGDTYNSNSINNCHNIICSDVYFNNVYTMMNGSQSLCRTSS